jgi:hypothetical protein
MDKEQKIIFIVDLVDAVKTSALNAVGQMPEEWNGIELRAYLAYLFDDQNRFLSRDKKRAEEFRNTLITHDL